MTQPSVNILQRIETLLRAGKQQEARSLLADCLKTDPTSKEAWLLMSQAVTSWDQKMDCVQYALRLDPEYESAREQLGYLLLNRGETSSPPPLVDRAEPPPQMKVQSTGRPIGTLIDSPSNGSLPSTREEKTASVSTEWVGLESKPAPLFKVPKKLGRNSVYLGAALLISFIVIVIVIGSLLQKKKAAVVPTNTIQATRVPVLPLAGPPTLAFSPSWTVSPALTGTATATLTSAPTLTPTLEITRTSFPASLVRPTPGFYSPDFTLPQLYSDHDVTLSQFFGKPVLVFFWATWSLDCRSEINPLKTLQQNYADQGLVILAINASESLSKVTAYQEANQLTYPVLLEQKNLAQIKYQVNSIPTHVFIDSEGKISYIHGGFMDLSQLEDQVKAILP